jgi:hypothetical protein
MSNNNVYNGNSVSVASDFNIHDYYTDIMRKHAGKMDDLRKYLRHTKAQDLIRFIDDKGYEL